MNAAVNRRSPAFDLACDMETPLATVENLCSALMRIAETMSDEEGIVVMRLAFWREEQCKADEAKALQAVPADASEQSTFRR